MAVETLWGKILAGTFIVSYPMSLMYLNFFFTMVYTGLFLTASAIGQCIKKEREETMVLRKFEAL